MPKKYSDDLIREAVAASSTYADVLRYIGAYGSSGSAHGHIKKRIASLGADTSHFLGKSQRNARRTPRPDVLVLSGPGEPVSDYRTLVKALVQSGVKQECEGCQNPGIWRENALRLHLDHRNGNRRDNRRENLRFLCPNCHDQTETWGRTRM